MRLCSIASGSSGNCIFAASDSTNLLIDAGISGKRIEEGLVDIGHTTREIGGILITHEHSDHVQSLATISKKFDIPVYANQATWEAMPEKKDKIEEKNQKFFVTSDHFEIGDLMIKPFSIPHDAAEPCGFTFSCKDEKIGVATDIGHITNEIMNCLEGCQFLLLESNYEPEVLKCSRYPYLLKTRIAGPNGHLSNQIAGQTIAKLVGFGLKEVMLGHLSKENNFPELALKSVWEELHFVGIDDTAVPIYVASRTSPTTTEQVYSSFDMAH